MLPNDLTVLYSLICIVWKLREFKMYGKCSNITGNRTPCVRTSLFLGRVGRSIVNTCFDKKGRAFADVMKALPFRQRLVSFFSMFPARTFYE